MLITFITLHVGQIYTKPPSFYLLLMNGIYFHKRLESVSNIKHYLNIGKPNPNKLFFVGKRRFQIIHTRLRNECSSLEHHLFIRNIVDSPLCVLETNQHYFFECPLYRNERNFFLRSISHFSCLVDLNTLLFGSDALPFRDNKELFLHVHFI